MKFKFKKKILKSIGSYFAFFAMVAFLVTCSTMLFATMLSRSLNVTLDGENLNEAAKLTFLNVILLSILFTVIDTIRRKLTIERAAKQIKEAASRLVKGDFSARVEPIKSIFVDDNLKEISKCFNKMAEELSGVETIRTDFISNVSHEMKTPLSVMQNYATLLQSPDLPEKKRIEYAKSIAQGSKKLADMMTNILKLNRLENQKIYPKTSRYNLGEQLCECIINYETVWEQKNIELEADIAEEIYVDGDEELLTLVWNNLLSNAFKFTDEGGKVTVILEADEEHVIVKIKDTGCGISSDVGARIFEKFYQADTARATAGNGLGLALVKRVIDILKGEIEVSSVVGEGTTFTVKLSKA
ncbi:MAG: HAMP domain-containing histidine kinase [Lachnospiraceae bacterium]|nr:HAMP domain-containing histidine kinase [Lachnospiraceae bacterium]